MPQLNTAAILRMGILIIKCFLMRISLRFNELGAYFSQRVLRYGSRISY